MSNTNSPIPAYQLSSNFTFLFKLAFPVSWIAFFGTLTLYILFSEDGAYLIAGGMFTPSGLRISAVIFMLIGIATLYYFFFRLQRIDADAEYFYVTNYFKSRRYPYHDIEKVKEHRYLIFKTVSIYLKESGYFGKRIPFIASKRRYAEFLKARPDLAAAWKTE